MKKQEFLIMAIFSDVKFPYVSPPTQLPTQSNFVCRRFCKHIQSYFKNSSFLLSLEINFETNFSESILAIESEPWAHKN